MFTMAPTLIPRHPPCDRIRASIIRRIPLSSLIPNSTGRSLICAVVISGVSVMPQLYRITSHRQTAIPIHANDKV